MKTKLLKKLRKRFRWEYIPSESNWLILDRKTNELINTTQLVIIYINVPAHNDAMLFYMMCKLGVADKYYSSQVRRDVRCAVRPPRNED